MLLSRGLGALVVTVTGFEVAHALQFNQPRATPVSNKFDANGWTPKPTSRPKAMMELFKRQDDLPEFCGFLEGDPEEPIFCDIGACMYDDVYKWFGCCTGTSITDCDVVTACVPSKSIDDCLTKSGCYDNPLVMACANPGLPFCATLYTEISGSTYGHFACYDDATSLEVVSTTKEGSAVFSLDSSFFLETDTSFSRSKSTATSDRTSSISKSSLAESASSQTGASSVSSRRAASQSAASVASSSSTARAVKTAEAMIGAAGGIMGMIAALL